jgi:disease resistance protein RPS2
MDMLGPILDLVKMILAPIRKCCNFHRGVDEEMRILREKWKILENRKVDTESRMKSELLPGKQPKKEVKGWLEKVDTINGEIQAIEGKFAKMNYFSRAHIGKLAFKMRGEVEKHLEMGVFTESLVVDPPVSHGEILPTPPTLRGETIKEEIWACVLNDDVRKIGVYGMGGIGKSTVMKHINNSLLNETQKFESVIWVTVSKAFDVIKLQHDIASKLNLDLSKFEDITTRASKLYAALKDKKRHVLILDDLWEAFPLEDIGLPEPTHENGCKLVLTTRLLDVCRRMGCKDFKMELLSNEEARKLFLDKMGRDVFDTPELKAIAEEVLERCAQLPLAIVTIAASFKCLIHDFEWRDALEDLKTSVKASNNIEAEVFKILEFSYERLKDGELQQCLLHCALYPEDFKIEKRELIEHLIDEGIIERRNSRQAEFDRGYSMLNKLENACLLEGGIDEEDEEKFVKMHDLVRDMVLRVASPQFKVEGHLGLEDFSDEGKWREDLVKASLMYNNISRIPPNVSPMCPKLSTLLLQGNRSLKDVPDSLFEHLHGLNVLDLSNTGIESLPNSVSNLENLTTLRLGGCGYLKRVPSLAKLTKLRKLDLGRTKITEVPDGLEMLVNLRYLNLNARELKIMPPEILPKLSRLQYLAVFSSNSERGGGSKLEEFGNIWRPIF